MLILYIDIDNSKVASEIFNRKTTMNKTNFYFIKSQWPELFKMASQSEYYAYSDPQSSIIKLRSFSELMVTYLYQGFKLHLDPKSDLFSRLKNQKFIDIVNEKILSKFHAIRIKGNSAVHDNKATSKDAIWLIEEAYLIVCWFYKGHANANQDICKEFVTPIDYGNKEDDLKNTKIELEKTHSIVEDLQRQINNLVVNNEFDIEEFKDRDNKIISSIDMKEGEIAKRISIEDIFLDYKLTSGQTELIKELKIFLSNKTQNIFLLKGYAGTGKTFITKGLTEYLSAIGKSYVLAAPTGKAAKVIKEKTQNEAFTIHKTIYSYNDIKEYKVNNIDGSQTFKYYFNLANNINSSQTIYIIDESSMVSDKEQEGEFFRFGSGKLLTDLLEYINLDHNDHNKKIIFIGDNAQLPPVGMRYSPALDETYLKKEFNVETVSFELTEVVRQAEDSGILKNSIQLRESIQRDIFNQLDFNLKFPDIKHIEHEELLNLYLESCDTKINGKSMIIAHSNTVVDSYNSQVRKHFFPNKPFLCSGDKVMAIANNNTFGIFIYNGDFGLVRKVDSKIERKEVFIKHRLDKDENSTTIRVPLQFKKIEIGFNNIYNKAYFFECYILENILYPNIIYKDTMLDRYKQQDIKSIETKALYVDFTNRAREKGLKPNTEEFKQAIKSDKYFNCLKIKFGYAITCHKAQGSEWDNVFVDCKTHASVLSKQYFRWLYTAITRASKKLYTLDEPHFDVLGDVTIKSNETSGKEKSSESCLTGNENPFEINNKYLFSMYQQINSIMEKNNIKILNIKHGEYHEIYTFESNNKQIIVKIIYKGNYKVSTIVDNDINNSNTLIITLLKPLIGKIIVVDEQTGLDNFDKTFKAEYYEALKNRLLQSQISIVKIEHFEWYEQYTFKKDNNYSIYKFYFNARGQFNKGDSQNLIQKVIESL